jgi:hypothetical protein
LSSSCPGKTPIGDRVLVWAKTTVLSFEWSEGACKRAANSRRRSYGSCLQAE